MIIKIHCQEGMLLIIKIRYKKQEKELLSKANLKIFFMYLPNLAIDVQLNMMMILLKDL